MKKTTIILLGIPLCLYGLSVLSSDSYSYSNRSKQCSYSIIRILLQQFQVAPPPPCIKNVNKMQADFNIESKCVLILTRNNVVIFITFKLTKGYFTPRENGAYGPLTTAVTLSLQFAYSLNYEIDARSVA